MASVDPTYPATPGRVEADPKRPWKAIVAAVVALAGMLWNQLEGREDLASLGVSDWLHILIPTLLAFAATYAVRNPKVVE